LDIFLFNRRNFLRFNSSQQSLSYSIVDNLSWQHYITEGDGAYFIYSNKGSNVSYHAISQYGDKCGVLYYKAKVHSYGYPPDKSFLSDVMQYMTLIKILPAIS